MVPDYESLMLPLLEILGDGRERTTVECRNELASRLKLTEEEELSSYPAGVAGLERRFAGSAWEACMRLAATLQEEGEAAAAALARELGDGACARARELAVWLFTIADARSRTQDALAFNALDASWPEIQRLMAAMDRGGQQGRFA